MADVHISSNALVPTGSNMPITAKVSPELKLPVVADVDDLVLRIQDRADILSRLLFKDSEDAWRKALLFSANSKKNLDKAVEYFCILCEKCISLLQSFFDLSQDFITLFASALDLGSYYSIEEFAIALLSQMGHVPSGIDEIQKCYQKFKVNFNDLIPIAPSTIQLPSQGLSDVFRRLDAFWRVNATYLQNVLDRRSEAPSPTASQDAVDKFSEYKGCLSGAMDALQQFVDALTVVSGTHTAILRDHSRLREKLLESNEPTQVAEPDAGHIGYNGRQPSHPHRHEKNGSAPRSQRYRNAEEMSKRGFASFWSRLTSRLTRMPYNRSPASGREVDNAKERPYLSPRSEKSTLPRHPEPTVEARSIEAPLSSPPSALEPEPLSIALATSR